MKTFLDEILADVATELASTKAARPANEIRAMLPDSPPVRSLAEALRPRFGLIAEIKERSPSVGAMRPQNVAAALPTYAASSAVHAVSILTNALHFGMSIHRLAEARPLLPKPILRKDFIIDEYQIREARAFGADAILLMANVLDASRLAGYYDLAQELGMEALFEVHEESEIAALPPGAVIVGINSRKFKSTSGFVGQTGHSPKDFTLDFSAFDLAEKLPASCLRVAESGLTPETLPQCIGPFHAALIGTSLLRDPRGLPACLAEFEAAMP